MSDNSRNSGEHGSSDDDNKVQDAAKGTDSENEITSTSKNTPVAAANPLLVNLLQKPPVEEDSQSSLITYSGSTASNDGWEHRLKNLNKFMSNQKEYERRSLKRKLQERKGDKSDSSFSDEDIHPAKKQLFDTSTESAMSSQEYQTLASEPCQPLDESSTAPTDSVVPSLNVVPETPQGASNLEEPSSVADQPTSIGTHSNKNLPESSEGDQSSHVSSARKQYGNDIHSNGEHEGPNNETQRYPGATQVRNITPLFEALLHDLLELRTFLDGRCVVSAASSASELVAGPSSGFTASDIQLAKIDPDFGTGVESYAAKVTRSVLADFDRIKVPELDSVPQSENAEPTANETPSVDAAVAESPENAEDTSEASNNDAPSTGSPKLNPEVASLRVPSEITSRLNNLNADALDCLNDCIDTTESVLNICLKKGVQALRGEMEKHVIGILDMLRKLVELRQDCSLLLKKCRNPNDRAGVTYILQVKTHIAKYYNQLLSDILGLNDNFHEKVQNSPPSISDD